MKGGDLKGGGGHGRGGPEGDGTWKGGPEGGGNGRGDLKWLFGNKNCYIKEIIFSRITFYL